MLERKGWILNTLKSEEKTWQANTARKCLKFLKFLKFIAKKIQLAGNMRLTGWSIILKLSYIFKRFDWLIKFPPIYQRKIQLAGKTRLTGWAIFGTSRMYKSKCLYCVSMPQGRSYNNLALKKKHCKSFFQGSLYLEGSQLISPLTALVGKCSQNLHPSLWVERNFYFFPPTQYSFTAEAWIVMNVL